MGLYPMNVGGEGTVIGTYLGRITAANTPFTFTKDYKLVIEVAVNVRGGQYGTIETTLDDEITISRNPPAEQKIMDSSNYLGAYTRIRYAALYDVKLGQELVMNYSVGTSLVMIFGVE